MLNKKRKERNISLTVDAERMLQYILSGYRGNELALFFQNFDPSVTRRKFRYNSCKSGDKFDIRVDKHFETMYFTIIRTSNDMKTTVEDLVIFDFDVDTIKFYIRKLEIRDNMRHISKGI